MTQLGGLMMWEKQLRGITTRCPCLHWIRESYFWLLVFSG